MIYIWEPLWSQTRAHEKKGVGLTWGKKKSKNCKNVLKAKNDLKKKKKKTFLSNQQSITYACLLSNSIVVVYLGKTTKILFLTKLDLTVTKSD